VRSLAASGHEVVGLDLLPSRFTTFVGSIADAAFVERSVRGIECVLHAATLHKPHVVTHTRQEFVETNITGTLNLLEASVAAGVRAFVYTSTTSVYGEAMRPDAGESSVWVTEDVIPIPRNIYGVTKRAAEDLCELFQRKLKLPCIVLRTSRFFPDVDDDEAVRDAYADGNVKVNEYLYRRVDIEDVVTAHVAALERAASIGFGRYVISATTPFAREDVAELGRDAPAVVRRLFPQYEHEYARRGWRMFPTIDRVYVNERARTDLGCRPQYDYARALERLRADEPPFSALAQAVGFKGYHAGKAADWLYPTA
jgi:UDP-glucose 4-epimerase